MCFELVTALWQDNACSFGRDYMTFASYLASLLPNLIVLAHPVHEKPQSKLNTRLECINSLSDIDVAMFLTAAVMMNVRSVRMRVMC